MIKANKFILLIVLSAFTFACATSVEARRLAGSSNTQKSAPRTVLDYYRLLPAKYLNLAQDSTTCKPVISVNDAANGYLALGVPRGKCLASGNWESWAGAEIALFKKRAGGYVIAVAQTETMTVSNTNLVFLEYDAGEWRSVTDKVAPKITDEIIIAAYRRAKAANDEDIDPNSAMYVTYDLPRNGRSIVAKWDAGNTLFKLTWNGERFEMK